MVQLGGVLLIRNGLLAFIIGVAFASTASAQSDLVKRGDYLVNGILTCGNCHTPKGPSGGIMDKAFSGGLSWDAPPFKVTAPNITQDKETGIGNYTDAELKQLLRKGIKDPIYKMEQGHPIPPGGESPYTEAMLSDKVKQGFYLATIAHCMECHTPMGSRGREFANKLGAGGFEFPGPWGVSVSRNITSSKTKGIGGWTDDEIKRAVTQGVSKDGSKLNPPMGFYYYATVSAADLDAIVAYLRTVPPKE
jgi:mono/diheme cytochrome c family protein